MFNSLIMCLSCNNKYKNLALIAKICLIINLFYVQFVKTNIVFFICNILLMIVIPTLFSLINNRKINNLLSILSILVYSVCIDLVSFYIAPVFPISCSIFEYVANGILFNAKFIVYNFILVASINLFSLLMHNANRQNLSKKYLYNVSYFN